MSVIEFRVRELLTQIDREHRHAVVSAFERCDGALLSFQEELSAQTWDYPDLPVQTILYNIAYDVA